MSNCPSVTGLFSLKFPLQSFKNVFKKLFSSSEQSSKKNQILAPPNRPECYNDLRHFIQQRFGKYVQVMKEKAVCTWHPFTMDWNPEPQSRFTVTAGTSLGIPARRPTCLAKNMASEEVWNRGEREKNFSINLGIKNMYQIQGYVGNLSRMINHLALT